MNFLIFVYSTITISPQTIPPTTLISSQPIYVVMHLVSSLLPLSVLGMGRVGIVPLTPACALVSNLISVLLSVPSTLAFAPTTLAATVVITISIESRVYVTPESALLDILSELSYIGAPTSVAALTIPCVEN